MRKIVLSVSRNAVAWRERDAALAQAGGFAVAPALSVESALQKIGSLPFCAVVLGASLTLQEKRRFLAGIRGKKHFSVISIHQNGDSNSGADVELDGCETSLLIRTIEALAA